MKIALEFSPAQSAEQRNRLRYAFQLFCAVYGHKPILDSKEANTADVRVTYSSDPDKQQASRGLRLYNGYRPRALTSPAPQPCAFSKGGKSTVLFYPPEDSADADWLAEIFEWTSCAHEYSVRVRDSVGRIPFDETVFARYKLDQRKPYAALAMWFLQHAICELVPGAAHRARAPEAGLGHAIVCSHDVDFLDLGYLSTLLRLSKNSLIALLQDSLGLAFGTSARALVFALGGNNPLASVEWLASLEQVSGVASSFNFIVRHGHRRDANYQIESQEVIALLRRLESMGMDIGVHGSYTSLDQDCGLAGEYEALQKCGFRPLGGRQHWLRFSLDRLIPALERAGALFDTSLGWQHRLGFRAGACFPFPPYNFAEERPARFLEFPLAVMDQALPAQTDAAFSNVAELLATSRAYGWGGISLLWHPEAFGGGQLPMGIGHTFSGLVNIRSEWKDTWLSGADFIRKVCDRYIETGLMDKGWGTSLINVNEISRSSAEVENRRSLDAALP